MVRRKKPVRKTMWITEEQKQAGDMARKSLIIGDSDLYARGIVAAKKEYREYREKCLAEVEQGIKDKLSAATVLDPDIAERMGIRGDANCLLESWFGNTGPPESLSEYARRFAGISEPKWLKMAESEKNKHIAALLKARPELLAEYGPAGGTL